MAVPLLATKLHIPPLRPGAVARPRLLERLDAGLQRKLTLVSAPAGFGKTTLLSEWYASPGGQARSVAWVLLDEQDNDPVRFWSYVLAALEAVSPGIAQEARLLLQSLPSPSAAGAREKPEWWQAILTAVINDLAGVQVGELAGDHAARPSLVLVLDDYHTIYTPAVHDSLAFFLDYMPVHVHVVLLSRADPPLSLARLRARDQLIDLRAADLCFTTAEASLFLNRAMALRLPADMVSVLEARTEGWAAGLQLAALSLQGLDQHQARQFIAAFTGTHRHILNYLTEEVLHRQSPQVQAFLLQTSILPYLTAPLCDAVVGQPGSQGVLEQLAGDNLFITPLDDRGQWYRYHPLFADILRARLQQTYESLLPVLHCRAAEWYRQQGAIAEAMDHFLAASDWQAAARLVEEGYKRLVMRGELVSLHRWLDALPPALVRSRPRLGLAYALSVAYAGHRDQVEGYLRQAEEVLAAAGEATEAGPAVDPIRGEIAAIRAVVASVHWSGQRTLDLAKQALQLLPPAHSDEDRWLRVLILQARGNCHRLQGQAIDAGEDYGQALATAQLLNSPFLIQAITNRLGQNQVLEGRLRQAVGTFEAALQRAEAQGGELLWFSAELLANLGRVYTEWNDLDVAWHQVLKSIELGQQAGNHLALLGSYLALAGVQAAQGEKAASSLALDRAQQLAADVGVPYLGPQVAAHQAWLSLAWAGSSALPPGPVAWVECWASRRAMAGDEEMPVIQREFQDIILARLRLRQGRAGETLELAAGILPVAEHDGRMRTVIQVLVLRALALQQQGNEIQARDDLARALALAEPEGYVRMFLDEGEAMRSLLAGLEGQSGALAAYVDRLLADFRGEHGRQSAGPSSPANLQDPLTVRELEILALLAAGASNQEIAGQLVLSVGTVKGHVNHILGKLGARNRTEAVAHARELGLLKT